MYLRKLELKDAPFMLEWMHNENVTANLQADFASKTLQDAEQFIVQSQDDKKNLNLAIVSDIDEYMGTVSLKHINDKSAEFAITVRRSAMGKGYAKYGMEAILKMAISKYGLKYVYWCVNPDNYRAVRFYEKNNYVKVNQSDICIEGGGGQYRTDSEILLVQISQIDIRVDTDCLWEMTISDGRICG